MLDKAEFTFTHSQKRGILLLVLILLVALAAIATFEHLTANRPLPQPNISQNFAQPVSVPDSTIRLDINLADSSQWALLKGVSPRLAARIVRYRNSIGGFKDVSQVSKVYGLSPELFERIKPDLYSTRFSSPRKQVAKPPSTSKKSIVPLDINTANAEAFEQLPGIGKTLSRRIVKYRNSIGGFSDISELKRVYYLQPDTYEKIKPYLFVEVPASIFAQENSSSSPNTENKRFFASSEKVVDREESQEDRKLTKSQENSEKQAAPANLTRGLPSLDLNTADSASLARFPALEPKLVVRIIKYRRLLGFFYSIEQLKQVYGLSQKVYDQISPYLTVGNIDSFPKKDINIVFARNLAFYPFIDKAVAEYIVEERKALGHFKTWDELLAVPGVSSEILEKIRIYFEI